jgi:hypothetical protein
VCLLEKNMTKNRRRSKREHVRVRERKWLSLSCTGRGSLFFVVVKLEFPICFYLWNAPHPPPPTHARSLAHGRLENNQQSTFAARLTSINTVYYSFFKSSANREWVEGRETPQSYSSGELALQLTLHFIGSLCVLVPISWEAQLTRIDAFSGSASHCEPVVTCAC